eukprot:scaffold36935_cov53-Cyclotella_meneghiniana.AAC.1
MKLTIASMFIASSSLGAPSVSASGVAASILEHGNNKRSFRTAAAKKQGVECTLANTASVQKSAADVDVLSSCRVGEVCVEDSTSKIGGRCELVASASDEAAALEPLRELEDCVKCSGVGACRRVFYKSKIGCGSCIGNGNRACRGIYGDDVPANACNGDYACQGEYTATVTTSVPSSQPSLSLMPSSEPTHPGWKIIYDSMKVTVGSTEELIFIYNVSSSQAYEYKLLEKDCSTEIEIEIGGNLITDNWTSKETVMDGTDRLALFYDINMTAVPLSPIWNQTSEQMEMCLLLS